jgi:hypothetical protein
MSGAQRYVAAKDASVLAASDVDPSTLEEAFDVVLGESVWRGVSNFWTPVDVARRAAAFLAPESSARVLDVGAGIGKFCIVGALTTNAAFSGIEQRPHLVEVAKRAARELGASRTNFAVGTIESIEWSNYDALYFFNPFEENIFHDQGCLDRTVVLSESRFFQDVIFMEQVLARMPLGTRVATFHGFGGRIPSAYRLAHAQPLRGGVLRCWTKGSLDSDGEGTLEALMGVPG